MPGAQVQTIVVRMSRVQRISPFAKHRKGMVILRGDSTATAVRALGGGRGSGLASARRWLMRAGLVVLGAGLLAGIAALVADRGDRGAVLDMSGPQWDRLRRCSVLPEYERCMKKVLISLASRDVSLALHHELLCRLPAYAQIIVLLDQTNMEVVATELRQKVYRDRVELVSYEKEPQADGRFYFLFPEKDKLVEIATDRAHGPAATGSMWAQDLVEVTVARSGRPMLLVSDAHKHYRAVGGGSDVRVVRDNMYLGKLAQVGLEVQPIPVTFMGGNLLIDNLGDRRIALCGGDVLRTTRTSWRALRGKEISDGQIVEIIKNVLNVDEVVVVGRERVQPRLMYHLDQAMLLLPDGVVAVAHLVDEPSGLPGRSKEIEEVEEFLGQLRLTLSRLGYRLLDIDTSVRGVMECRHYVNAIPYIDAEDNQRTILLPVFPSSQTGFEEELVSKNTAALESLGYKVVQVPTRANELRGGIHCLVNVLE